MAFTQVYKDGALVSVNNNILDRYKNEGWSTNIPNLSSVPVKARDPVARPVDAWKQRQTDMKARLQANRASDAELDKRFGAGYAAANPATQPVGQVGAGTPTASPVQPNQMTAQQYIDQLNAYKREQTIAALDKSRQGALSNLSAEKATIQPKYYDARNQTAAGSQQSARNFAEFMAARGGTSAGSNVQAELSRNMSLQGNLGELGRQETAAFGDIARRTSDVENAYQSDTASAIAGLEAARMEALINQYNADRGFGLQEAGVTGQYQGALTPAGQSQQITNQINQLKLQNLPQELKLGLEALQQDVNTGRITQQEAEYKLNELTDPNSITNQANILALEAGRLGNEQLKKQIEQIGRAPYRSPQQVEMDRLKLEGMRLELENAKNPAITNNVGYTQEQANAYNSLLNSYTSDTMDPQTGLEFLLSPTGRMSAMQDFGLNEGLYNQLVSTLQSRIPEPTELDNKTSIDNLSFYKSELETANDAEEGLTLQEALTYAQNQKATMTDTDYRNLVNWINDNIF